MAHLLRNDATFSGVGLSSEKVCNMKKYLNLTLSEENYSGYKDFLTTSVMNSLITDETQLIHIIQLL